MSDHDQFDGRIRRALDDLGAGASHSATPMPPRDVRHRGARRRHIVATASITAIFVVVGGGSMLLADVDDNAGPAPVVTPTSTPSPTTTPSPTRTTSTPTPTVAPTTITPEVTTPPPTVPPAGLPPLPQPPPPTVGPWAAGNPATEIPDALKLPNEGDIIDDPDFSDWETTEEIDAPWLLDPCGVDWFEEDALRTDRRQVALSGIETHIRRSLTVWGDAQTAVDVMTQMRNSIESCVDDVGESGWVTHWQLRTSTAGGESFVVGSVSTSPEGDRGSGGPLAVVMRVGNAIYMEFANADGDASAESSYAVQIETLASDFAPNMCVFTMAGCPG